VYGLILREVLGTYLSKLSLSCYRKPVLSLFLLSLSFAASVFIGATHLKLQLAWTYLFHSDDPVVTTFLEARDEFPYPGDIAVLVDRGTVEQREQFVDLVAEEMLKEPEVFHHVFYRLELTTLSTRALYFLDDDLLEALHSTLSRGERVSRGGLVSEAAVKIQLKLLKDLKTALLSRGRSSLVPIWRIFTQEDASRFTETLLKLLNGERYLYATLAGDQIHVLLFKGGTRGASLSTPGQEVVAVRELLERLSPASYGLRVRVTGVPVMLHDERQTCAQDSLRSGAISFVLILLVFTIGFGGLRKPLYSLTGLMCGLGWTFAYAALTVGHLNFITVTMVSMLMGLGIDFGIHFLFRFQEECELVGCQQEALARTVRTTGVDTLVGAAATSASFFALSVTDFRGVSDLGILAGGGVLFCFFSTLTVLPALLKLDPRMGKGHRFLAHLSNLEEGFLEHYKATTLVGAMILLVALAFSTKVGFSYNLLSLQAQDMDSVQTEKAMISEYNSTVLSGSVLVNGRDSARRVAQQLRELPSVRQVSTVTDLLPEATERNSKLVKQLVEEVQSLRIPTPVALDRARDLKSLRTRLHEIEEKTAHIPRDPTVVAAVDEVKGVVSDMRPGPLQDGLRSFQRAILADFTKVLELLKAQKAVPLALDDLPDEVVVRYVSPEGTYLLNVQPAVNIWKRENLEQFLAEVDGVGVTLVGHPVVQAHILESFDHAFRVTPFYTLFGVFSVMLLYVRKPARILLSSLPTVMGVVLIFGVMGATGLEFNVVNFVGLPISVGIGAVYGVHALHRMEEIEGEALLTTSTGHAILLSGLTTIAGFASLMTAQHGGLSSFGFVISVGVMANLLVSLVFLPAVCRWMNCLKKT
jgi:hopanoid biosynthesis associated RND transporter like protein HpnN